MTNPILTIERDDALIEGEVEIYVLDASPEGTPSAATIAVYVKGNSTAITGEVTATATCTISGDNVTAPAITVRSGDGGAIYRIVFSLTLGSRTRKIAYEVPIAKIEG